MVTLCYGSLIALGTQDTAAQLLLQPQYTDNPQNKVTPPTVNKTIIIAHRLQLFLKMRIVNTKKIASILAPLESLRSEEHESAWKLGTAPIIN